MNNELPFLFKMHTDTLIEQTNRRPQGRLEFKLNNRKETFSFNPPLNLIEEMDWFLAVTSFEATNFVFDITNESNCFFSCYTRPLVLHRSPKI